jgi:hypothetical protein
MTTQADTGRGTAREDRRPDFVIRTPEGFSAIQVKHVRGAEASQRAISELLGPVYEQRTDRRPALPRSR